MANHSLLILTRDLYEVSVSDFDETEICCRASKTTRHVFFVICGRGCSLPSKMVVSPMWKNFVAFYRSFNFFLLIRIHRNFAGHRGTSLDFEIYSGRHICRLPASKYLLIFVHNDHVRMPAKLEANSNSY